MLLFTSELVLKAIRLEAFNKAVQVVDWFTFVTAGPLLQPYIQRAGGFVSSYSYAAFRTTLMIMVPALSSRALIYHSQTNLHTLNSLPHSLQTVGLVGMIIVVAFAS